MKKKLEVEPADETMAEYYDSDMDFPGEDSDVDQCCMHLCMPVSN